MTFAEAENERMSHPLTPLTQRQRYKIKSHTLQVKDSDNSSLSSTTSLRTWPSRVGLSQPSGENIPTSAGRLCNRTWLGTQSDGRNHREKVKIVRFLGNLAKMSHVSHVGRCSSPKFRDVFSNPKVFPVAAEPHCWKSGLRE